MNEKEQKTKKRLSIVFSFVEMALIILLGLIMKISMEVILLDILIFEVIRKIVRKPMHYKDCRECAIWTLMLFAGVFLATKIHYSFSFFGAAFASLTVSEKGDVKRSFLFDIASKRIIQYIHNYQENAEIKEFERRLKMYNEVAYDIYKYRYIDGKTQRETAKLMNMDERRVAEKIKEIDLTMKVYFSDNLYNEKE